jgi:hypothetical protein
MIGIFGVVGALAVVTGGILAAFSARTPTTLKVWASAYLVLVAGVIQVGLVLGWHRLDVQSSATAIVALVIYNLGNIGVLLGTVLKYRLPWSSVLVNAGGGLLAVSMALLLWSVRKAAASWTLAGFCALTVVILISMPIGLALSSRRR